ncbi:MAG TPA: histidine phosphatase family protein [Pseudonocardiaceae bacterium]|nr:histidine phosphatase family protein [Pseudonocardiaceae bacterium]
MAGLRLMLVRHGQTESNVRRALDSKPPGPPLNPLGQQQADDLAADLAEEPIVSVYASIAVRAQQTAEPLAAKHGLSVHVVPGAHEIFVGDLEGSVEEADAHTFFRVFSAWADGDLDVPMPGGETGAQARDRFERVIAEIAAEHREGVVVLVSHGGIIRLVAPLLADNVSPDNTKFGMLPNTGRIVLDNGPAWRCVEWTGLDLG